MIRAFFAIQSPGKPVIDRVNKSCSEEMGNWAEKTFQNGVGIIYSLARDVVTLWCREG
jgi:hypothetical protein